MAYIPNRISVSEAIKLYRNNTVNELGVIANEITRQINGEDVFFNRNIHIEPTNVCVNHCLFCSYRRNPDEPGSWEYSIAKMVELASDAIEKDPYLTELHIVGGVHPNRGLEFYSELLTQLKQKFPHIHIKAFTAQEIVQMCQVEGVSVSKGLDTLKNAGLQSMPGGGAEIFDPKIRKRICPDKISGKDWLSVHKIAHQKKIATNATMLYGHYDGIVERIEHLNLLRNLQDETNGFNAFIPLKFKAANNKLSYLGEVPLLEDLKTFAISRIFLDNIPHIKAYWPMLGMYTAMLLLDFGVDDLDGTIDDSTKIYEMAGGEVKPGKTSSDIVEKIQSCNRNAVERDSLYNIIRKYSLKKTPKEDF